MHVQIESLEINLKKLPLFDDTEMRVKANAPEENPGITCKFSAHFANAWVWHTQCIFSKKSEKVKASTSQVQLLQTGLIPFSNFLS